MRGRQRRHEDVLPGPGRRLSSIVAAALAAAALATTAPSAQAADEFFGVNVNTLFQQGVLDGVTAGPHLDSVRDAGIRLARTDAYWAWAEPLPPRRNGRHLYTPRKLDAVMSDLASRNLRWLPILTYSPVWATSVQGNDHAPPKSDSDYADGAAVMAARYGSRGTFWDQRRDLPRLPVAGYEIWNEPNLALFWSPQPDPVRYAGLYAAARAAIKQEDPVAPVLVGGLVPNESDDFLRKMHRARPDLKGNVDAVGFHPYASSVERSLSRMRTLRETLDDLGERRVPIHVTEVGWTTQGEDASVPDETRGANITLLGDILARSDCRVESYIPYTWVTPEEDPDDREHWYGITRPDRRPTEASLAYSAAVKRHREADEKLRVCDIVSERFAAEPLKLTLSLRKRPRGGVTCWDALASYRGRSLNDVRVEFEYEGGTHYRRTRRIDTDDHGIASYCLRVPPDRLRRTLSASAAIGEAAGSRTVVARVS